MDLSSKPRLSPGCRLHPTEEMLLVPEGALQLSGPARDILMLVDSNRDILAIVENLSQQYSDVDRAEIQKDVVDLLERLKLRGLIRT